MLGRLMKALLRDVGVDPYPSNSPRNNWWIHFCLIPLLYPSVELSPQH